MPRITLEAQVIRDKKIEKLLREGLPQVQIAKDVKCSASTVNKYAKKLYKPDDQNKWVDPDADIMDTQILKKMIPLFVDKGLKVMLTKDEVERVKELWKIIEKEN